MFQALVIVAALLLLASTASAMRGFVVQEVESGVRTAWTSTRHAVLAREAMSRVLQVALTPIGWFDAPLPGRTDRIPVVLVPDPAHGRGGLVFLHTFLAHRGAVVWPMRFPRHDQTLAERADHLASAIAALRQRTGAAEVDVVAFGTGGLVAAWWMQHHEAAAVVHRLVTLGTPWRGTRMAVFLDGCMALEARPGSADLDGLAACTVPCLAIWCPEDPEVVPASSAYVDEARSVAIEGAGHLGLLLSARAFRAVLTGLRQDDPEPASVDVGEAEPA